jgi:hypothetical protein
MELFIPSIFIIVLGSLVVFFLLPKLTPYTLGVMALLLFGVGIYQHYITFPYEYTTGNFRDTLRDYAPFLMLLAVILALITGIMVAFGASPPSVSGVLSAMPNVTSLATMQASLPTISANIFGGNGSTAKNSLMPNVKRNNVASTSFKVT